MDAINTRLLDMYPLLMPADVGRVRAALENFGYAIWGATESLTKFDLCLADIRATDPRRQRRCARRAWGKTATDTRRQADQVADKRKRG